jgi:hypothetical protein
MGGVTMNNCIYLKNRKGKPFCKKLNKEIAFSDCSGCTHKEYKPKKVYRLKSNKPITQRTKKQAKAERDRFSLFTDDLTKCIICGKSPVNKHEIFYGSNRQNSIKYGLVIPLCTTEHHVSNIEGIHKDKKLCKKWQVKGQKAFMEHYNKTKDEFINLFGKNYLD